MSGVKPSIPYQTYSFQALGPTDAEGFELPVTILGTGKEIRHEATYRWDNERHRRRSFHVLQYTLAGSGLLCSNRSGGSWADTRVLGPGDLFAASWDQEFEYRHPGNGQPWEFLWIIVEGPLADRVLGRVRRGGPVVRLGPESPPVLLLENLLRRLEHRDSWDRYALSTVGYEFCLCLLKETETSRAVDDVEREAGAWVLAHLADADCPSLAARFGYNEKYFSEFLRRHTGLTPQKFIQDRKMRYACSLLTSTARSIGAISADLGFAEDNYFSKVFRRHAGQSPQDYRRTHQESLVFDELVPL